MPVIDLKPIIKKEEIVLESGKIITIIKKDSTATAISKMARDIFD